MFNRNSTEKMFSHHFSENTVQLIEKCQVFVKIEVIYIESGKNFCSGSEGTIEDFKNWLKEYCYSQKFPKIQSI